MPRVPSVSLKITAILEKQIEKFEQRALVGELGDEDLKRLEALTRINKLNLLSVRMPRKTDEVEIPEEIDDGELEKDLRQLAKTQNPDFFVKRGRKPGPTEPIAPPPPKICETVDLVSGHVCTKLAGHEAKHVDSTKSSDDPTIPPHFW